MSRNLGAVGFSARVRIEMVPIKSRTVFETTESGEAGSFNLLRLGKRNLGYIRSLGRPHAIEKSRANFRGRAK